MTTAERILAAAERRVRAAGYNGFSFRDLAEDVGIKSASVHHHFPTKAALVARLAAEYTERFLRAVEDAPPGAARIEAYRRQFRASLEQDRQMCLCGMLGSESLGLPEPVILETRRFFEQTVAHLSEGLATTPEASRARAIALIARLEGALIVARALDDLTAYDTAVAGLQESIY
ncbi:MAG: TetR/AcrR family transcriptional regulator [Pseudomonadota bacterium]